MTASGGRPTSYTENAVAQAVEEIEALGGPVDAQRVKDRLVQMGEATPGARLDGLQPRIERVLREREEARQAAWHARVPAPMRDEIKAEAAALAERLTTVVGRLHEGLEEEAGRAIEEVLTDKRLQGRLLGEVEARLADVSARLAETEAAAEAVAAERDGALEKVRVLAELQASAEADGAALRARVADLEAAAADTARRLKDAERARDAMVDERDVASREVRERGDELARARAEVEGLRAGLDRRDDVLECLMDRLAAPDRDAREMASDGSGVKATSSSIESSDDRDGGPAVPSRPCEAGRSRTPGEREPPVPPTGAEVRAPGGVHGGIEIDSGG